MKTMTETYDAVIDDINEALKRFEKKKLIEDVKTSIHHGTSFRTSTLSNEGSQKRESREEIIHVPPRSEKMIVEFTQGSPLKSTKKIVKCSWPDEISAL